VLIDSACLHKVNGVQHFPSVDEPVLRNFGWYCDDINGTFRALRGNAIPLIGQFGEPAEGDAPPTAGQGGSMKTFFASPPEVGLRYQFLPLFPMPTDPRTQAGWTQPPVAADYPLGLEFCSHHGRNSRRPTRTTRRRSGSSIWTGSPRTWKRREWGS
jgi:hypothetical protein